jgi:15-cis-phytoene desaturase
MWRRSRSRALEFQDGTFGTQSAELHPEANQGMPHSGADFSRQPSAGAGGATNDVIIVGGGIAGLSAAVALSEAGLRVVVVERDHVLGGRARTVVHPESGDPLPIGPHVFLEDYANMRALLERLGTGDRIVWQQHPHLAVTKGRHSFDGRLDLAPPPLHFLPVLGRLPELSARDLLGNLPALLLALQIDERDVARLDDFDAARVLRWLGVSERSRLNLWSFISRTILNVPLERCSAGALFRFCRFLLSRRTPRFGFPDRGLGDVFAPAAKRFIERAGGEVRTRTSVQQILIESRSVQGVRLSDGSVLCARVVIASTPADALLRVLPECALSLHPPLAELSRFSPVPYISVFLWFDRKLTQRRFWARSFRAADFGSDFYDLSNIYRGYAAQPSLLATNIIDSERVQALSDANIIERIRVEVAELLPEARAEHITRSAVHRIPMAIHAPSPGAERGRLDATSPIDGLILAGDWTRTGLPSCMEGAALSGGRAAESVLARLGRVGSFVQPLPAPGAIPAGWAALSHALPIQPVDALLRARQIFDRLARVNTAPGASALQRVEQSLVHGAR